MNVRCGNDSTVRGLSRPYRAGLAAVLLLSWPEPAVLAGSSRSDVNIRADVSVDPAWGEAAARHASNDCEVIFSGVLRVDEPASYPFSPDAAGFSPEASDWSGLILDPVRDLDAEQTWGGAEPLSRSVESDSEQWGVVELRSICPNPSRGTVVIRFALGRGSDTAACLAVFDVTGRRVADLFDGLAAGQQEVSWDGTGPGGEQVAAGVYFARIQAGGARRVRRFVLLN